jgi:hypothetical protein
MNVPQIPIDNLDDRHPGLLPSTAANYLDAARVCLDRHHNSPANFNLSNDGQMTQGQLHWQSTNDRDRNAWANLEDATRDGAYALALATIEYLHGFVAVRRAQSRTGADYYISPIDQDPDDFEQCYRLEVSGTHLNRSAIQQRLRQKIIQTQLGTCPSPAIVAIVGFQEKVVIIQTVEDQS